MSCWSGRTSYGTPCGTSATPNSRRLWTSGRGPSTTPTSRTTPSWRPATTSPWCSSSSISSRRRNPSSRTTTPRDEARSSRRKGPRCRRRRMCWARRARFRCPRRRSRPSGSRMPSSSHPRSRRPSPPPWSTSSRSHRPSPTPRLRRHPPSPPRVRNHRRQRRMPSEPPRRPRRISKRPWRSSVTPSSGESSASSRTPCHTPSTSSASRPRRWSAWRNTSGAGTTRSAAPSPRSPRRSSAPSTRSAR